MLNDDYYAATAYRPDGIPDQPDADPRGLYMNLTCTRLPWGRTQEAVPDRLLNVPTPHAIRDDEKRQAEKAEKIAKGTYQPTQFDGVDLKHKYDHENFRVAKLPFNSQFWLIIRIVGKYSLIFIVPIFFIVEMLAYYKSHGDRVFYSDLEFFSFFVGPFIVLWFVGHIVVVYFPSIWFRPPRGPIFDLNRRTGLVTLYDYKNFKKTGVPEEISAPFYEFDAYIFTTIDRSGGALNVLWLMHRYRQLRVPVGSFMSAEQLPQTVCALWDFYQNFMDISRPLPEVPRFEEYRHLDPVTAEHDRKTQRKPRYWADMDDETFKRLCHENAGKVDAIDTFSRPNLMVRHVKYAD
ncbi:MAG: hypothetical protein GAK45_00198 [Pseudomonas citronellolis]|nr:MAG: hypothetical protein GAK45_00198 [Pseudomonas citronellolis]